MEWEFQSAKLGILRKREIMQKYLAFFCLGLLLILLLNGCGSTLRNTDVNNSSAVPSGLSVVAGNSNCVLSWTANSESDLAGYYVYRSLISSSDFAALTTNIIEDNDEENRQKAY